MKNHKRSFREPIIRGPILALTLSNIVRRRYVERVLRLGAVLSIAFSFAIYLATRNHGYWAGIKVLAIWLVTAFLAASLEVVFRHREIDIDNKTLAIKQNYDATPEIIDSKQPIAVTTLGGLTCFGFLVNDERVPVLLVKKDADELIQQLQDSEYSLVYLR